MSPESRVRTPLTRTRIIEAALRLVDSEGLDGLSMRRLGEALGVDPMAVYYHVPNKAALHDGILEHLWGGVVLPPPQPDETWQEVLAAVFRDFRRRLLDHPRAVMLAGTRSSVSSPMLRLVDDTLGRLVRAGLAPRDAMELLDCLTAYTIGKTLAEAIAAPGAAVPPALAALTAESHPQVVAAMADGYGFAPDAEFERGLAALIAGWA